MYLFGDSYEKVGADCQISGLLFCFSLKYLQIINLKTIAWLQLLFFCRTGYVRMILNVPMLPGLYASAWYLMKSWKCDGHQPSGGSRPLSYKSLYLRLMMPWVSLPASVNLSEEILGYWVVRLGIDIALSLGNRYSNRVGHVFSENPFLLGRS